MSLEKFKTFLGFPSVKTEKQNYEKIEDARGKVNSALSTFHVLKEEVSEAIDVLNVVVKTSDVVIANAQKDIDDAHVEIIANKALLEKINNFIN